jgi:hypothetical protein
MKTILVAALTALLVAPAALAAEPQAPGQFCATLRSSQPALFGVGKTYRNLGACVSSQRATAESQLSRAAKACNAEMADPTFATSHDGKTFSAFYGTGGSDNAKSKGHGNAFGKCVSDKASQAAAQQQAATAKAAKACRAELRLTPEQFAAKYPGQTFASKYGTNTNGRNAFGKCVSAQAKTA